MSLTFILGLKLSDFYLCWKKNVLNGPRILLLKGKYRRRTQKAHKQNEKRRLKNKIDGGGRNVSGVTIFDSATTAMIDGQT